MDIGGRGAAAAAHDAYAVGEYVGDGGRIGVWSDVVDGAGTFHAGKSGVRLHDDGLARDGEHSLGEGADLGGSERAVDAKRFDAEGVERARGDLGRGAQKRAAVCLEGHGGEDGQVAAFLCCEHRGPYLREIRHGLDEDDVDARGRGSSHLFGKELVCLLEVERAEWTEQRSQRADITGDVAGTRGTRCGGGSCEHLLYSRGAVEFERVRAEGIRRDDFGARLDVGRMDAGYGVRVAQVDELGACAGGKTCGLEHSAHAAIEDEASPAFEHRTQVIVGDVQGIECAGP